jgi:hypothetical protein
LSSLRNDLCRLRRDPVARQVRPVLPVYTHYPVLVNLRNRLLLCLLRDRKSPRDESCGPSSPTDEWWCNLRMSHTDLAEYRSSCRSAAALFFRGTGCVSGNSGRVSARPAEVASLTDVCFLTISDHGRIEARPKSRQRAKSLKGLAPSGVEAVAHLARAVFHSKETGSDQ